MIEIAPKEYEVSLSFDESKMYCFLLNVDGKLGWRLPTIEELEGIYTCINDFRKNGWYWSSTEVEGGVWFKSFSQYPKNGPTGWKDIVYFDGRHTIVETCLVRPVRDLKDD